MDETLSKLLIENQNLIYSIANYFKNYSNKEDLFQVGAMGFIKAYKKYDKSMNVKLTTYAFPYILGEMKKFVCEDRTVKVGRDIQKKSILIERTTHLLTQKLMREPTISELAMYLNFPEETIVGAVKSSYMVYSMDEVLTDQGKEMTLNDFLGDKDQNIDQLIMLREELSELSDFERKLIEKRYFSDMTQAETARILGMSQVQVSRKEQKILTKMRRGLAA